MILILSASSTPSLFHMLGFLCRLEDEGRLRDVNKIIGIGLASLIAVYMSLKLSIRRVLLEMLSFNFNNYSLDIDSDRMRSIFISFTMKRMEGMVGDSTLSSTLIDNGIILSLPHHDNGCEVLDSITSPSTRIIDALDAAIDSNTNMCIMDSYPYQLTISSIPSSSDSSLSSSSSSSNSMSSLSSCISSTSSCISSASTYISSNAIGIYVESQDKRSYVNFIKTVDAYRSGVHYHLTHTPNKENTFKLSTDYTAKLIVEGFHRDVKEAKRGLSYY